MHVCLFDIDGTLLNTGGAGQAAMEAAMREQFGEREPIAGISYAGRTDRGIIQDIFRFYGLDLSDDVRASFIATYLRHLPTELARRPGLILPGVVELLSHLQKRDDVILGLLTGNLLEGARRKLQHHGLDEYFDFALGAFGDEHVHRDDVARAAHLLLSKHAATADRMSLERLWVIGDTPADIQCARAIGAKSIAVATGIYSRDVLAAAAPDCLVESFEDAEPVLENWL
jgi:phosphoglycolate phosphatase